jgi:hypothetical protein
VKLLRNRTLAIKLEDAYEKGERDGIQIGRAQGESGMDMMAGELLKAAFADPVRVRYAYEKAKAPTPADPKAITWRLFLKVCADTAGMSEDTIRAELAELGVVL